MAASPARLLLSVLALGASGDMQSRPLCDMRVALPPVEGRFRQHDVPGRPEAGRAWELDLKAGCSYSLWERANAADCLKGVWVVIIGASQTEIWTSVLANMLAPEPLALLTKRDGFNIDGMFTQLVDIIIEDGNVTYRKVVVDPHRKKKIMKMSHTWHRDRTVLEEAFQTVGEAPKYSKNAIRITNFMAEYWDSVPPALEAVRSHHAWKGAKVTVAVSIGLWYVNSYICPQDKTWCATRPHYEKLTLPHLIHQFHRGLDFALDKMEPFCAPGGPAGALGCAIAGIDHCPYMKGKIWSAVADATRDTMMKRGSEYIRFIDLWTLTKQLPQVCLGGHQTPMSSLWTWQVLLGGICIGRAESANGRLALFKGPTCTSRQVFEPIHCRFPWKWGFQTQWECAISKVCELEAVAPAARMHPIHLSDGTVPVGKDLGPVASPDEGSADQLEGFRRFAMGHAWQFCAGVVLLLAFTSLLVVRPCSKSTSATPSRTYAHLDARRVEQS